MMADVDISIVVTLHEFHCPVFARTLASLNAAAAFAVGNGTNVELIVLQCFPEPTIGRIFQQADLSAFSGKQLVPIADSDSGWNAVNKVATGTYIVNLRAEDLISFSFLARMLARAEALSGDIVWIPKFVLGFDTKYLSVEYFDQKDISIVSCVKYSLFPESIFVHRSFYDRVEDAGNFERCEDYRDEWCVNANAIALGYDFRAVDGAVLFSRRDAGLGLIDDERSILRDIRRSQLFEPRRFLQRFAGGSMSPHSSLRSVDPPGLRAARLFEDSTYREIIARANAIDPSVELGRYLSSHLEYHSNFVSSSYGRAYCRLCEVVGTDSFDAIFLLSDGMAGEEPDPTLRFLEDFARLHRGARIIAIVDEDERAGRVRNSPAMPAVMIDVRRLCPNLSVVDRDRLCFRLLQAVAPNALLHFATLPFGQRFFGRFKSLFNGQSVTCYRLPDLIHDVGGYAFVDSTAFDFICENLDFIDQLVPIVHESIESDEWRLPSIGQKYQRAVAGLEHSR